MNFDILKRHSRAILIIIVILLSVYSINMLVYFVSTKEVYYLNKDSFEVMSTRIRTKTIGVESEIQGFLRNYLAGSTDYQTKIPFIPEVTLLSVSHDRETQIVVLNWNAYFYKAIQEAETEQEIGLLLRSLKKNFSINKIYFLVEGTSIIWDWNGINLRDQIEMTTI